MVILEVHIVMHTVYTLVCPAPFPTDTNVKFSEHKDVVLGSQ